jgi:asparagine synthase (glutamine-hydrolysing)
MCNSIAHRGPDDAGVWSDASAGVVLGHRRLSILDLSPQGHQPMVSACGRYVIAFNGEIYNHGELRERLEPHGWRGHSDTETILECFSRFGVVRSLPSLVGMFAIAVWDRQARELTLARDRMGEKPLYYGRLAGGELLFGSELRALEAHPAWRGEIDRESLAAYMRYNYVPAPRSIYRSVRKLQAGYWLTVGTDQSERTGAFWSLRDVAASGQVASRLSDGDAVAQLEDVLGVAVRGQMMADVPLGAFLSGGVDSSAIVALMCKHSSSKVRTFSIGFREPEFNEAEYAKAVARHLGTEHTELYVTAEDALQVVPQLPDIYDEPFADASQIPTYLVMRMARQHVTVALSGDGGDELFAGYNRYLIARRLWKNLALVPRPIRLAAARMVLAVSPAVWDTVTNVPGPFVPKRYWQGTWVTSSTNSRPASCLRPRSATCISRWSHIGIHRMGGFVGAPRPTVRPKTRARGISARTRSIRCG